MKYVVRELVSGHYTAVVKGETFETKEAAAAKLDYYREMDTGGLFVLFHGRCRVGNPMPKCLENAGWLRLQK